MISGVIRAITSLNIEYSARKVFTVYVDMTGSQVMLATKSTMISNSWSCLFSAAI